MNELPEARWTYLDSTKTPAALQLVEAVVGHRAELERLGVRRTEDGYGVCWARLERGQLSKTQVAAMHIARGLAVLEMYAAPSGAIANDVVRATAALRREPRKVSDHDEASRTGSAADPPR